MVAVCQLLAFAIYLGGIMATLGLLNNHEEDKNHFCFSLLLFFFPNVSLSPWQSFPGISPGYGSRKVSRGKVHVGKVEGERVLGAPEFSLRRDGKRGERTRTEW